MSSGRPSVPLDPVWTGSLVPQQQHGFRGSRAVGNHYDGDHGDHGKQQIGHLNFPWSRVVALVEAMRAWALTKSHPLVSTKTTRLACEPESKNAARAYCTELTLGAGYKGRHIGTEVVELCLEWRSSRAKVAPVANKKGVSSSMTPPCRSARWRLAWRSAYCNSPISGSEIPTTCIATSPISPAAST